MQPEHGHEVVEGGSLVNANSSSNNNEDNSAGTTPQPAPPSPAEKSGYYYGLPSRPPLVDRSSTTPWAAKYLIRNNQRFQRRLSFEIAGRLRNHNRVGRLWQVGSEAKVSMVEILIVSYFGPYVVINCRGDGTGENPPST